MSTMESWTPSNEEVMIFSIKDWMNLHEQPRKQTTAYPFFPRREEAFRS